MAMGGKVAEELIFGKENITSGAASDIQQITKIARAMVTQFGFSEQLGNVDYANEQQSFLGAYSGGGNVSPETQEKIDEEVRKLVDEGYDTAKRILTEHGDEHQRLAEALLEYETLTGAEILKAMKGEPIPRGDDDDEAPTASAPSITAIPKTKKPKSKPLDDSPGGMEPEPT